jgi:hypothetical protein
MSDLYFFDIKSLVEKYNLKIFIETGSADCQGPTCGLLEAKRHKLRLNSCDLNPKFVEMCLEKFPEANILNLDSREFLKKVLPMNDEPTLFWLDAHFPTQDISDGSKEQQFPILQELFLIKDLKKNFENDVIMCDDIHTFNVGDNPIFNPQMAHVGYNEHSIEYHKKIFADTHDCELIKFDTGVLIYTPKAKTQTDVEFLNKFYFTAGQRF